MAQTDRRPTRCSIGIMAHNEGANIGSLLEAVVSQRTKAVTITEIIVVASACTDETESIVQNWEKIDNRVRLMSQSLRQGKAAAVNQFLDEAREEILVLCSADLRLPPATIEKVVAPLADADVGMTTGHPLPVNDPRNFMGFAAHLLWNLHHQINLKNFKAGELIAFRKILERIPHNAVVDEANIEPMIRAAGYALRYVPTAIVENKGPETVADFVRQRRRIYAGHLALRETVGYTVSTMFGLRIFALAVRNLDWRPREFFWTWGVAALEIYGRFLGWCDHKKRRDHSIWEIAETTKDLGPELSAEQLVS